jgi:hypothetical protein
VSDFLRATLAHDGRHEHSLAEELALLDAYLDIEKARLGERLRLTMKAGPDLLDSAVPYLMLQPLVENAIRHGIAPLAAPGRLDIRVERAGRAPAGRGAQRRPQAGACQGRHRPGQRRGAPAPPVRRCPAGRRGWNVRRPLRRAHRPAAARMEAAA